MTNVLEYLERSAERLPDKTAVSDINKSVTYNELLMNSRGIGSMLKGYIDPKRPIPVLMEKGVDTLEIFLGIVYAGGCYSLVDPQHPMVRIDSILNTLDPEIIITDREHLEIAGKTQFITYGGKIILVEGLLEHKPETLVLHNETFVKTSENSVIDNGAFIKTSEGEKFNKSLNDVDTVNDDASAGFVNAIEDRNFGKWDPDAMFPMEISEPMPLYINFTSGSTGVPKGVVVGHESVIEFIDTFVKICDITEKDVIGNQAPFDFDVSVKDIYSALCVGAELQIVPRDAFPFPVRILDFVCDRKITTMIWAVSSLCIVSGLKGFEYRIPTDVNKVIFSGEVMPIKHLNIWREAIPNAQFINVYGPTEITCNCTYYKIDRAFELGEQIPIGLPIPGEDVFLLDENNNVVSGDDTDKPGELCVGGISLALGYYNNPEQTARAFVPDPRPGMNGKIYRTGDLAYYMNDGNLMFMGRRDFQIKHMGHRIELNEIEMAMEKVENLVRCCVIYNQEKEQIIAFYQGDTGKKEIVDKLKELVPVYMIPNKIRQVEAMPLNDHGKIDRKALLSSMKNKSEILQRR